MQLLQILAFACVVLYGAQVQGLEFPTPMCSTDPKSTVSPGDPRLPILPSEFEVHVEGTIIDQSMTVTADEYVSVIIGASSLQVTQGGNSETVILNTNTNESYHIFDSECTVYNRSTDVVDVLNGGSSGMSSMPHTYSTASVLKFAQKYGEVYKGQKTVRGISCDHWQSCMYWGFLGVNFTLDYYFSVSNWTTADGSPRIPVRAEIIGYQNLLGPGPDSSFHHIYDYTGFKSYLTDITVFQTPVGVACEGRRQTRRMPQLRQRYRYRQEVTHLSEQMVYQEDVWYDYNLQLVRWDHRPTHKDNHYNTLDAITEIHDFNTGVAYVIYKDFPRCNIFPIQNNTWDATRNASTSSLRLKQPEEMFSLDSSYAYSGQRTVRGMACDVYSAVRADYESLRGLNVTFEIYFISHDWHSANDIGTEPDSTDTPVRQHITEPTTGYEVIYDYYDFDQTHPNVINAFDITSCYRDNQDINFQITFPGNTSSILPAQENVVHDVARMDIAGAARVTPLRIQDLEVHWDENNTYIIGTLLYQAPLTGGADHEVSIGQAYTALDTAVTSGQLVLGVPQGNTSTVLNATSITTDIWRQQTSAVQYSSKLSVLHHFTFSANRAFPRGDGNMVLTGLSLEDCAGQCLAALVFSCRTFQYQPSSGKCSLTSDLPDTSHTASHVEASHVYTRDYTLGFGVLYSTYIGSKSFSETHPSIPTVNSCAQLCIDASTSKPCTSFNYAQKYGTCVLESHDLNDVSPSDGVSSTIWNHYSRDYSSDFKESKGYTISQKAKLTIQQSSVTDCAMLCVAETDFSCDSFIFCTDLTCRLQTESLFDVDHVSAIPFDGCSIYNRMHYPNGRLYLPHDLTANTCLQTTSPSTTQAITDGPANVTAHTEAPSSSATPTTTTGSTTATSTSTTIKVQKPTPCACVCNSPTTSAASTSATVKAEKTTPCACEGKSSTLLAASPSSTRTFTGGHKTSPSSSATQCGETSPSKSSPATGTLVGVAIAMLVLGGILGGVIVFFIQRRRGGDIKYDKYITNPAYTH
ncbi:uncharacterized protein LOC124255033 isoform X2 [Haliotis rubra]|uniref:uncharacterized protein LOC124255033 isoform X2 n=1 Tax=Haliotis rubra TaxID=36100 RepID=UPI001EE5260F|nr:uncharacterized protein LOC124255033 isoform X2 [Haliotis rubra]